MQLAQNLAGYTLGEADMMRRAMGKKKKEEMAKHEEKFISGAISRGIQEEKARKIFTLMEQFADYGFNRSHSFAYAYLAYQTAWLKAHYPTHFYAAVLSNEIANSAKLARYIGEMKVFEIEILPPDINSSHEGFTPVGKAIRFGLAAIKGLGSSAVQMIIRAREDGGPFRSIYDFAERVDQRAVNKRVLESLIKSGAFDGVAANRAAMMAVLDKAIEYGARAQRDKISGQTGLFGDVMSAAVEEPALPSVPQWSRKESLALEKESLGFYASGHPLEDYAEAIKGLTRFDSGNIEEATHGDQVALGGIIVELVTKTTKKGDRFALFRLEDQYGSVKVVCWPEQFNKYKNLLQSDEVVLVKGKLELSDEGGAAGASIIVQEIHQLERARSSAARAIIVRMPERSVSARSIEALGDLISRHQGSASVLLEVETEDGMVVQLRPQQFFRVNVAPELTAEIEKIGDNWQVELVVGS
jgi:DNA polymerase III subunit alpha